MKPTKTTTVLACCLAVAIGIIISLAVHLRAEQKRTNQITSGLADMKAANPTKGAK